MIIREVVTVALLVYGLWLLWGLGTVWGVLPLAACLYLALGGGKVT